MLALKAANRTGGGGGAGKPLPVYVRWQRRPRQTERVAALRQTQSTPLDIWKWPWKSAFLCLCLRLLLLLHSWLESISTGCHQIRQWLQGDDVGAQTEWLARVARVARAVGAAVIVVPKVRYGIGIRFPRLPLPHSSSFAFCLACKILINCRWIDRLIDSLCEWMNEWLMSVLSFNSAIHLLN